MLIILNILWLIFLSRGVLASVDDTMEYDTKIGFLAPGHVAGYSSIVSVTNVQIMEPYLCPWRLFPCGTSASVVKLHQVNDLPRPLVDSTINFARDQIKNNYQHGPLNFSIALHPIEPLLLNEDLALPRMGLQFESQMMAWDHLGHSLSPDVKRPCSVMDLRDCNTTSGRIIMKTSFNPHWQVLGDPSWSFVDATITFDGSTGLMKDIGWTNVLGHEEIHNSTEMSMTCQGLVGQSPVFKTSGGQFWTLESTFQSFPWDRDFPLNSFLAFRTLCRV